MEEKKLVTIWLTEGTLDVYLDVPELNDLVDQLKLLSFIRVGDKYINKMHIHYITFESPELLKDLQDFSLGRV